MECDDEDYCINADEEWIREAFINIIQNSSELCDKVKVKAVCRDDKCIVNIKDNGSGFEEDRIPYIFDRFETTGSAAAGHAGIGLNLSRLIIKAHHGTVDVRNNEDGKGAVIRVQIPNMFLRERLNCKICVRLVLYNIENVLAGREYDQDTYIGR